MKIHAKLPEYRLPCLQRGNLQYLSMTNFKRNPFILSCLSQLTERNAWLFESQAIEFAQFRGTLAVFLLQTFPSTYGWKRSLLELNLPVFMDPLKRLCRTLRFDQSLSLQRGESFIFDQHGSMILRIFHDLTLHGISTVLNVAERNNSIQSHTVLVPPSTLEAQDLHTQAIPYYPFQIKPRVHSNRSQSAGNSELCA